MNVMRTILGTIARPQASKELRRPAMLYWRRDQERTKTVPLRSSQSGVTRGSSIAIEHSEVQKLKQSKRHTRLGRHATLKDLCSEDKHRVRQLIEDLARVGSEKEIIERRLRNEREQNQELLSRMKKQQLELAEEKHQLECELHDSQLKMQSLHMYPHTEDPLHSSQDHLDDYHYRESSSWSQVPADHSPPMIPGAHSQQKLVNIESILTMPSQKPSTHESHSSCVANTETSRLDRPFLSAMPPPTQYRAKFQTQPLPFTETTAASHPLPSWPPIPGNGSFVAGQPVMPSSLNPTLPSPSTSLYRSLPRSSAFDTEVQEKADFITPSFDTWTGLPPATPVKQEETEHHINTPDNTWTRLPPSTLSPDGITESSREYPCSSKDAETQTIATESIATQTTPHHETKIAPSPTDNQSPPPDGHGCRSTTNETKRKIAPPTDNQSPPPTQQLLHQDASASEPTHNERDLHVPLLHSLVSSDVIGGGDSEVATALLNAQDTVSTIQTIARLNRNHDSSQTILKDCSVRMEKDCAAESCSLDSPLDLAVSLNMNQSLSLSEMLSETTRGRLMSPEENTRRPRTEEKIPLQEPDDSQVIKDLFFL